MASRFNPFLSAFITLTSLLTRRATALQVTPNSPCASFCVDSDGLDLSDPGASSTKNGDITCYDSEYTSSRAGQKFQRCISCLQDSPFAQGKESDQLWFLYNIRYAFDYCVFGFPEAEDVASTPCSTSTACGELQDALTGDGLRGRGVDYTYCSADGGAMGGEAVEKCLACVAASDNQDFLANYIVALDAGCKQQPAAGELVGLNDTVFSRDRIGAVDPETASSSDKDDESTLSMGAIVGVAIGAGAVALAVASFIFVRCRKRRNRRLRLDGGRGVGNGDSGPFGLPGSQLDGPVSPLSFRCQTSLSPRSPDFHASISGDVAREKGQDYHLYGPHAGSSPIPPPMTPSSMWGVPPPRQQPRDPDAKSRDGSLPALHSITTTMAGTTAPTFPDSIHHSSSLASPKTRAAAIPFSPTDGDLAPASTTTAQLLPLRAYNPAEYGHGSPTIAAAAVAGSPSFSQHRAFCGVGAGISSPESAYASPTSGSTASPLLSRAWEQQQQQQGRGTGGKAAPIWDMPHRRERQPSSSNIAGALGRATLAVAGKGGRRVSGGGAGNRSPVETTQINTVFPAPPTKR